MHSRYLLIIQPTASSGGVSISCEGVSELLVQGVPQGARYSLPGQNQDNDDSILAVVAGTVPHQAQQLLICIVSPDDLEGDRGHWLLKEMKHVEATQVLALQHKPAFYARRFSCFATGIRENKPDQFNECLFCTAP